MTGFTSGKISHDPKPWQAFDMLGRDYPHRVSGLNGEAASAERLRMGYRFAPRPEFEHDNPILVAFREFSFSTRWHAEFWLNALDCLDTYGGSTYWNEEAHPFHALTTSTGEQITHARRVLTRLANLTRTETS